MKINPVFFICIFFLLGACNQQSKPPANQQPTEAVEQGQSPHTDQLELNNGKKWRIDESTRTNISAIRQRFATVAAQAQPDHKSFAAGVEQDVNKLVAECKMTGKDHDMLHLWLEQFISTLKQLKDARPEDEKKWFEKMQDQLKEFDQYFE